MPFYKRIPPKTPYVSISMSMLSTYALRTHESEAMTPPVNIQTLQLNVAMTTLASGPEMKFNNIFNQFVKNELSHLS